MTSQTDFDAFRAPRALVREGDPPGTISSLRTLARAMLSLTDSTESGIANPPPIGFDRRQWGRMAQIIHAERNRRTAFFPADLFGEPAWDILLDLFHAAKASELRSVKAACISSNVPEATALRYIDQLTRHGLVERRRDRIDRRRKYLSLTALGQRKMQDYLASMAPIGDQGEDLIRTLLLSS